MSSPLATVLSYRSVTTGSTPLSQSQFQKSNVWSIILLLRSSDVLHNLNPQAKLNNLNLKSSFFGWGHRASHNLMSFPKIGLVYLLLSTTTHSGLLILKNRPESVNKRPNAWQSGLQNVIGVSTWILDSCVLQHWITCNGTRLRIGLCVPMMATLHTCSLLTKLLVLSGFF